mmetsp:Transcript_16212/g.21207  ORF Transcript_16212/g.21207 Transcript_16212/m.21207 type:complete len:86 (+) Transcript_16212:266-523(+)
MDDPSNEDITLLYETFFEMNNLPVPDQNDLPINTILIPKIITFAEEYDYIDKILRSQHESKKNELPPPQKNTCLKTVRDDSTFII